MEFLMSSREKKTDTGNLRERGSSASFEELKSRRRMNWKKKATIGEHGKCNREPEPVERGKNGLRRGGVAGGGRRSVLGGKTSP